jgi:hypothetical protein
MFCLFKAKNDHGSEVINLRVDITHKLGHRNRWNRSTYGWEAMRGQVQTHYSGLHAVYGVHLVSILWWAVENEMPGNWEPHLKSVELGNSTRIDLDYPLTRGIDVDLLRSLQLSESKALADFGRTKRLVSNWGNKTPRKG